MPDKIEILYMECDENYSSKSPMTKLTYCEWRRNGKVEFSMNDGDTEEEGGTGCVPEIPDDVRVALALLIAPGLIVPVKVG